jgi:TnpA family transposase
VTRQSVIIAKLSSYPRKNRTKKALWELDNLRRSLRLLNYVDSPQFQRNIERALNRGESNHQLVCAVAYANGGKLRVRTDQEQQLWSECSRLLANCLIYYNAYILSELLERAERRQDYQRADAIKRANPASWKHVSLYGYGAYSFLDIAGGVVDCR